MVFIEDRNNIKFEEKKHGDEKKAAHISNQLKDVQVLVAKVFGPNIKNIRKNFVPIVIKDNDYYKFIHRIVDHKIFLEEEMEKETKNVLILE